MLKARRKLFKPIYMPSDSLNWYCNGVILIPQGAVQKLKQVYLRGCALPSGFECWISKTSKAGGTQIGWWVITAVAQSTCKNFALCNAAN
jgi:hypothetical protein